MTTTDLVYAERYGALVGTLAVASDDYLHADWHHLSSKRAEVIVDRDAAPLDRVEALRVVEHNVAADIDSACRKALRNGASFADVAKVLGISRQAASKRFGTSSTTVYR